ncbi:HlyD family efflux transporter periplasmic adaptor subunit [Puniceicoccaceae bacterium K14]|nr:HlyD family efflux transporter periplasmic adaptor subunit [Puniceicoccaceae bacterium K14]
MDFEIENNPRKKKFMVYGFGSLGLILLAFLVYNWISPGVPSLARDLVRIDFAKEGDLVRQVRGVGTIVPKDVKLITNESGGIIERLHIRAGAVVTPETVIVTLSNPELKQRLFEAESDLKEKQDELLSLELSIQQDMLSLKSSFAELERSLNEAALDLEVNEVLHRDGLIGSVVLKKSRMQMAQLEAQVSLEEQRQESIAKSNETQLAITMSQMDTSKARYDLLNRQVKDLDVVAGIDGVLQRLLVEEGQQVATSFIIAEVADITKLKVEIRVPELRARDLKKGLSVNVDTGSGEIDGAISRIDPAVEDGTVTVDIEIFSEFTEGLRTDQTVEGVIQLENMNDIVYIGRPLLVSDYSEANLFRLEKGSDVAVRSKIRFGKSSVSHIEVLDGLNPGDGIIMSITDSVSIDDFDQVRIR